MKVLISDPVAPQVVEMLKEAGLEVDEKTALSPEQLIETIPAYHAIIIRSATKVRRPVIEAATQLKIIARGGVGLDNVDQEAAKEKGITVVNTPGASSLSVAELVVGQMLSISRHLARANAGMHQAEWEKKKLKGWEISKKTLGIVGLGNIGRSLACLAQGFSMTVLAYDPVVKKEALGDLPVEMVSFDDLLARADYVSLHLPLLDSTRYLFNAQTFSKMKKGAILVNCSRGGIVEETALAEALKSGHLRGAAVDVFEKEPISEENPLLGLPNVYMTPHIGASTYEGQQRVGIEVAEKVIAHLKK